MALSRITYTGDGVTNQYAVPFPYIKKSHVSVEVGGVAAPFTWVNPSLIQITTTPAASAQIKLARNSSNTSRLVDYVTGPLDEETLDADSLQAFYLAQESQDLAAEAMGTTFGDIAWDGEGKKLTNIANGSSSTDAATVGQLAAAAVSPAGLPLALSNGGLGASHADTAAVRATLGLAPGAAAGTLGFGTVVTLNTGSAAGNVPTFATAQIATLGPPSGRLTLTSGVPVTTGDVTGATSVLYTPYRGSTLPIFDGTRFVMTQFAELSQTTADATKSPAAVVANKVYDVFVWDDAGTLRATRGPAWPTDTSRGTGAGTSELQVSGGIYTNKVAITNGPAAGRGTYVGTIASDASAQINDSALRRNVWNLPHVAVDRTLRRVESTASWTYTLATWRQANGSASNQIEAVVGLSENAVEVEVQVSVNNAGGAVDVAAGIGINSTTVNSADTFGMRQTLNNAGTTVTAKYRGLPGVGRQTFAWLEASTAAGTTTWYGTNGGSLMQSGILGRVRA